MKLSWFTVDWSSSLDDIGLKACTRPVLRKLLQSYNIDQFSN